MTAIDSYFKYETFSFPFINSLFDLNSYEKPVENFIDDSLFFEIDPNVIKKANFFISQNEAELSDQIYPMASSSTIEFHKVDRMRTYDDNYSDQDGYMIGIYIRYDKSYSWYTRQVNTVLGWLSEIGGL
jgi:hypothetical protein